MKKLDVGQTISILANVGVIAGIIFLWLDLRQNHEQLEIQSRERTTSRPNSIVDLVLENPYRIDLQTKGEEELTKPGREPLTVLGLRLLLNFEERSHDVMLDRVDRKEAMRGQRAVHHRSWPNYGIPLAWDT